MREIIIAMILIATIISCKTDKKEVEKAGIPTAKTTEVTSINIDDFDLKAGDFVNQEIALTGIVDHVCKHGGKKLLLVSDGAKIHVTSEERFDDKLIGSEITLSGIVKEERIDEAYCLKMENDNIKNHSEGKYNNDDFKKKKKHIEEYRDEMKQKNVDHLSNYSLQYVSHNETK
ncbi:MAG: hypothetical protein JKY08_08690 [Flavobacteriaceae bacterium]|nr:hypothetical protein [Flavobacteriaceae bacterium]